MSESVVDSVMDRLRSAVEADIRPDWRVVPVEHLRLLVAAVEAAFEFSEHCLDRTPSAHDGQPDLVWLQGSANPTGLHLLDALEALTTRENPDRVRHTRASEETDASG